MKNKSLSSFLGWSLWVLASFFYAFQYVIRVSPSVMIIDILQKFGVTASEFGYYSGAYYLGYALAHLPLGVILDRYPLKWVVSSSIFLSVGGLIPLMVTDVWGLAVTGRFLIGVGSSGAVLSLFKVLNLYFPPAWFSRLLGCSVAIGLLGAIYGSAPIHRLCQLYGWYDVLTFLLIIGLSLSLMIAIFVPSESSHLIEDKNKETLWQECKAISQNKRLLFIAFLAALMVGPLEGFADVWAVPFLEKIYHLEPTIAASFPSLIFMGMCVGGPLLATIAEKFQAYEKVIRLAAAGMMVAFIILMFMRPPVWVMGSLFFSVGLLSSYQVLALTLNSRSVPEKYSAFAAALTNMIIMSFGFIYHGVIGRMINFMWDGTLLNNLPVYSAQAYIYGLMVIPAGLGMACVGFFMLERLVKRG